MSQLTLNTSTMSLENPPLRDASAPSERKEGTVAHRRTQSSPAVMLPNILQSSSPIDVTSQQDGKDSVIPGPKADLFSAPDPKIIQSRQKGDPTAMPVPDKPQDEGPKAPKVETAPSSVVKKEVLPSDSKGQEVGRRSAPEQEVPLEEEEGSEEVSDSTPRSDSVALYGDKSCVDDAATAAIREINDKIPSVQGRAKLYKAFRIIGQIASLLASAAAITFGVMTANPLLIIGGSIAAFKGFFDFLGECTDGKLTIENGVRSLAKFFGASENTAAWIGFGVGFSISLAATATSLWGGINAIGVATKVSKAITDFQNFSLVASKAVTLINTTIALADPNASAAAKQTQLSDDEVDMLAAQLKGIEDEGKRLDALRTLTKLAARYKKEATESGKDGNLLLALYNEAKAMRPGGHDDVVATGSVPQGFTEEDLQSPADSDIRESGPHGPRAKGIDQNQVEDIVAQKKRITRASRFFKALGGAAITVGGVLLAVAAGKTGGAGSLKAALAGGAAALKGVYTMVDGVVGMFSSNNEGLLKASGMKNNGLIASLEAILPLADVVLDGVAKGVNFNTNWDFVGGTKGNISAQTLNKFPTAKTHAALSAVDPKKYLITLSEAQAVLASYNADVVLSENMRTCLLEP